MAEEQQRTLHYRILRYTPNLIRDEWVNIGVLLEETPEDAQRRRTSLRRAARFVEDDADLARIRRVHPAADRNLLRSLGDEFERQLAAPELEVAVYLEKLGQTLSNAVQFSPQKAVLAGDFDAEMERLFRTYVARPPAARGAADRARTWIRDRLETIFRRHRILDRMERGIRVEEFTQPGDPMRLDYGYRYNGTRGYMQMVSLDRHPSQAKVLAYTAEQMRRRLQGAEFAAFTDVEPVAENRRHQFVARLLEEQNISLVPPNRVEKFAENLRARLQ